MTLRIAFMGTPLFSVPTLRALHEHGHDVAAVYTQPPRPAGRRGLDLQPSPVALEAERLSLPVRHPASLRDPAEHERFRALGLDLAVVVAYGLILPRAILDAPRFGAINGHASLLPRWRGAAPIQRAVEARDRRTGTMAMRMEEGLDTGPVAVTREIEIGPEETSGQLHDRLSILTAEVITQALADLEAGRLRFRSQDEIGAETGRDLAYARKIEKSETRVRFLEPAEAVAARINAFSPFPGAWCEVDLGNGPERLKLLRARLAPDAAGEAGTLVAHPLTVACGGGGAVTLLDVQRAGGKRMSAEEFARGTALAPGHRFG